MRHRGTLFAADDAEGIIGVFIIDDNRLRLEVAGEEWGGWYVTLVSLAETGVNEYQFNLNGDRVRFVPDSRLDFAYGAVPELAKAQEAAIRTYRARRKTKKATRRAGKQPQKVAGAASPAVGAPSALRTTVAESPSATQPAPKAPAKTKPAAAKSDATVTQPAQKAPAKTKPAAASIEPTAIRPPATAPVAADRSATAPSTPQPPPHPDAAHHETEPAVAAAAEVGPADTPKGELVIDLRTVDGKDEEPATPTKAAATNGHHPAHAAKADSKGGLRLLDRVRQSRAEHVHDYQVSSSGVMIRRVCSTCNHVSIGTAD